MIGPTVTIRKSCSACECERSEGYAVQGDSGSHVYCAHPAVEKKFIGSNDWETPDWCPAEAGAGETAKPVAWIRFCSDGGYEGPIADCDKRMDDVRKRSGAWTPLFSTHNVELTGDGRLYRPVSSDQRERR